MTGDHQAQQKDPTEQGEGQASGRDLCFLVPLNDLEALAVADRVRREGYPLVPLKAAWGERPILGRDNIVMEAGSAVLVELPDPATQATVEGLGHHVVHVDHHLYARRNAPPLDRRNPLSSLEQVAELIGARLSDREQGIAANDRGYIPALIAWATTLADQSRQMTRGREQADNSEQKERDRLRYLSLARLILPMRLNDLTVSRLGGAAGGIESLEALDSAAFRKQRLKTWHMVKAARKAVKEALDPGKDGRVITNGNRKGGHKRLVLVRLPEAFAGVGMDAVMAEYLREHPKDPYPDVVLLVHVAGQPDTLTQVEYSGPGDRSDHVAAWITPDVLAEWKAQRLTVFGGGGLESCYFVAKSRDRTDAATLNTVADGLLNDLLIRNRPVEAWRTSFLQPLYLGPDGLSCDDVGHQRLAPLKDKVIRHLIDMRKAGLARSAGGDGDKPVDQERHLPRPVWVDAEERGYFMPHVRDIVAYGPGPALGEQACAFSDKAWDSAIKAARRGDRLVSFDLPCEGLALVSRLGDYPDPFDLPLTGLRVHFFFNDTCILEWTVSEDFDESRDGVFWPQLLDQKGPQHPAESLDEVLDINAWLRYTHSARAGDTRGPWTHLHSRDGKGQQWRHGLEVSPSPLVGWFADLVSHALGLTEEHFRTGGTESGPAMPADMRFLADDRARVITSVVPRGSTPLSEPAKQAWKGCLARLHLVDGSGDGFVYDPAFSADELHAGSYHRYENMGTVTAATDHSFVSLGHGGFVRAYIHNKHMRTMYRRMALVMFFYGAILTAFSVRVSRALEVSQSSPSLHERRAALRRAYERLHEDQLRFTNHFWFTTLSSQMQGRELFRLLQEQARIQEEYTLVNDEIERMNSFLDATDARGEERREKLLTRIGLPFLFFVTLVTLAIDVDQHRFFLWPALQDLLGPDHAWIGGAALAGLWTWAVVNWLRQPPEPGEPWWWSALTRPPVMLALASALLLVLTGLDAPIPDGNDPVAPQP